MTTPHRSNRALRLGGLAAAVLLALPAMALPAMAQETASPDAPELDTITVTAQRRTENIQDVPMAITTLDREKVEALTASGDDIRLLSGRLPSLNIESSFGRAFPRFYVRGLGNTDFDLNASQPVSLVYDGVVQENPILKGFPLFDLDGIEMARGPQGTLFGRNSPAGIIKFESARPQDEFGGYARIGVGDRRQVNLEGAITGPVGEHTSARLSVMRQSRADWVDNVNNGPGDDLEGYEESAARLQFLFKPSDTFEALANVHARKLEGTARLFRASIIKPGTNELRDGFERDEVSIDGVNEQQLDQVGGNLRMRWDLGKVSLYSITGYESVDAFSRGDIDGGSVYTFPPSAPGQSLFPAESADGLPRHRQWSQEFRVESNDWGRFDWQAGLFWFDESIKVDSFSYNSLAPGNPQNGYATQRQENTAWAVFASGDFEVTDRFTLRGGLRYTDDRKDFVAERVVGPFGPPIPQIRVSPDDTNLSWDLSGVFEATDNVNLYARVATGFRAPSVQGRLMFADASLYPSQTDKLVTVADSETVLSYEAGVKATLWDNRLRLGFALYRYTVDDQQLTAVGGNTNIATLVNADRSVGQGAELDLQAWLTDHLFVTFGASYNDTEIQDRTLSVFQCGALCSPTDPVGPVAGTRLIDGNPLPQAPKHVYNLTARYGIPLGNAEFFIYTDWAYRSKVNFFLYESTEFTGDPLLEGGLRLGVNWKDGRYEVAAYGRNITDEEAIVGAIDFNNLTGFLNEPRTWGVEFKANF